VFDDPSIAGDWTQLVRRLNRTGALARWAQAEPALRAINSIDELAAILAPGSQTDADLADTVLGAVVRTASRDGAEDPDAVLLVLHLLADGLRAAAARLADLSPDVLALLVGELAVRIRTFPPRRGRAYAANLLRDTQRACLRELTPHRTRTYRQGGDLLIDPLDHDAVSRWFDHPLPADDDCSGELSDLLAWAHQQAIAPPEDLALLVEFERHRGYGTAARHRVAAAFAINERTLRRRRDRTLTALRAAVPRYLDDDGVSPIAGQPCRGAMPAGHDRAYVARHAAA
jgi:hypothetical protein